uniref:Uncharacterized protein LOC105851406 n=1 Tax=Cicer arietinum TaxID=3827 RepID=A0A3Q7Y7H3_CICAR|nr:uncharacterized protein LOC105851406 [Cicer arietinum]
MPKHISHYHKQLKGYYRSPSSSQILVPPFFANPSASIFRFSFKLSPSSSQTLVPPFFVLTVLLHPPFTFSFISIIFKASINTISRSISISIFATFNVPSKRQLRGTLTYIWSVLSTLSVMDMDATSNAP